MVQEQIDAQKLQDWRRQLHQIPELGFQEHQTAAFIREHLKEMELDYEIICDTGTLVYFDTGASETVAFRADIDALPIEEKSGVTFSSKHEGKMHACGHDGHTTILLGVADFLSRHKEKLKKNVLLIFQPAEEEPGGAKDILTTGVFEKYKVQMIYGLHVWPDLPEGKIGSKPGAFMAHNGELDVVVHGKSAHGAQPHDGIDAIVIASKLINEYQTILSRRLSPLHPAVITIGKISGGDAVNIIADHVELHGTVRVYSTEDFDLIHDCIEKIHRGYEEMYDCQIEWSLPPMYPPLINDGEAFRQLKLALEKHDFDFVTFEEPFMPAEDFSYYLQKVPGCFFFLGVRNEEKGYVHSLHSSQFNFDEKILATGVRAFLTIAEELGCL